MIKKLLLSLALIMSANAWAVKIYTGKGDSVRYEDEISFSVSCKVLDTIVFVNQEGQASRYDTYHNTLDDINLNSGDSFNLGFTLKEGMTAKSKKFHYKLEITVPVSIILDFTVMSISNNYESSNNKERQYFRSESLDAGAALNSKEISITDRLTGGIANMARSLYLKRYYKNDWSLIHTHTDPVMTHVLSANCMGMPSKYDTLLTTLLSHDEKYQKSLESK